MVALRHIKFKDFIKLQRGFDLPKKNRVEGEYPVVAASSIHGTHDEYKVLPPGVTTSRSGALGEVLYVKEPFWPLNTTLWVKDFKGNYPRYVYYYLKTIDLKRYNSGVGVPTLNRNHLDNIAVKIHPLPIQRKIAGILSAYDDLIENNLRRIKILEQMAQAVYREWFVNFRFPGHEKVKMTDSELGPIPQGWEVKPVEECFEISGGGTPSKKVEDYWVDGNINWFVPSDLTAAKTMFMDESGTQINELGLRKSSARMFPAFSVMMTSRATIGVVSINTTPACTNQGFITCIPNDRVPLHYLYYWVCSNTEIFLNKASGTTFKEIIKRVFKTLPFLLPPKSLLEIFQTKVQPLADEIFNLQRENANLRRTRDLLLPRLISGKLDVSDLDINMGEVA